MRAAVLLDTHHAEVREVPVPKPGKGQVLVKVNKVGVCASGECESDGGHVVFNEGRGWMGAAERSG